jgi:MraZ protein
LQEQIRQKARFDPQLRAFELFYIGGAHEVLADKQGRILVPPKLREFAALEREVTFSALTDHFQLWDKVVLEQVLKTTEQRFQDPEFFQKLGL